MILLWYIHSLSNQQRLFRSTKCVNLIFKCTIHWISDALTFIYSWRNVLFCRDDRCEQLLLKPCRWLWLCILNHSLQDFTFDSRLVFSVWGTLSKAFGKADSSNNWLTEVQMSHWSSFNMKSGPGDLYILMFCRSCFKSSIVIIKCSDCWTSNRGNSGIMGQS